jgi:hypothetical protein
LIKMVTGRDGFIVGLLPGAAVLLGLMPPSIFGQYGSAIIGAGVFTTFYSVWRRKSFGSPFIANFIAGLGISLMVIGFY